MSLLLELEDVFCCAFTNHPLASSFILSFIGLISASFRSSFIGVSLFLPKITLRALFCSILSDFL